jgi:hypothetical protein
LRTLSKKQKATVAGITLLSLAGTGSLAYAYWTTTGTGAGSGSTGTDTPFTITGQATSGLPLSPAGPVQTASFKVHNPGSGVQQMNQVVVTVANPDGSPWTPAGCSASDYSLGGGAAGAAYTITHVESIAAAGNSALLSASLQMVDTGANQNGCKTLTVPLYYAVS